MSACANRSVFIADHDKEVCRVIARILKGEFKADVVSFEVGQACLERIREKACDVLISNTSTVGTNGIDLLRKVKGMLPALPVIVISDSHDINVAVEAMKEGAFDFLSMPIDRTALLDKVEKAFAFAAESMVRDLQPLTATEQAVLQLLLEGKSSKEIAAARNRSVRTIEDQRCSIMKKLRVDSVIGLVKRVESFRIPNPLAND